MFGMVDKSRPQGVTFPMATDDKEVLIILNREALEPALIPMPLPSGPVMGVVAHGVGQDTQRRKSLIPPSSVGCHTKCQ